MRYTQPLTAQEEQVDFAMRSQGRTHAEMDRALTEFRLAQLRAKERSERLVKVADLLLGVSL
jgi:hypothetical protein